MSPIQWLVGKTVWAGGGIDDLDREWRRHFGVARWSEEEVSRWDGGEYGTVILYKSGRLAREHEYDESEIKV